MLASLSLSHCIYEMGVTITLPLHCFCAYFMRMSEALGTQGRMEYFRNVALNIIPRAFCVARYLGGSQLAHVG